MICSVLSGCDISSAPNPGEITGENGVDHLYNVTSLQREIISEAIVAKLRTEGKQCDNWQFIRDDGEYEDGEHFRVTACKQEFLVVFDLSQDKLISIKRLDESRPDAL